MVRLRLKRRRYDGRQHLDLTQMEFVEHILGLIPRPWHNLIRYHGVFAPSHAWRDFIVPHYGRPRLGLSMDCDMLGKREEEERASAQGRNCLRRSQSAPILLSQAGCLLDPVG